MSDELLSERRQLADRVNAWVRDAMVLYDVVGSRAVAYARVMHPARTQAEERHLQLVETVAKEVELDVMMTKPRNAIVITGI